MSKRRHRTKHEDRNLNNNNNNGQQLNNNPFGINPNQLLSLFGNIDMNQINRMLQSMNGDSFDFNNLNLGPFQSFMSGLGGSQPTNSSVQSKSSNTIVNNNDLSEIEDELEEDENIQMLRALKKIVNSERVLFIDKVIKKYIEGEFDN